MIDKLIFSQFLSSVGYLILRFFPIKYSIQWHNPHSTMSNHGLLSVYNRKPQMCVVSLGCEHLGRRHFNCRGVRCMIATNLHPERPGSFASAPQCCCKSWSTHDKRKITPGNFTPGPRFNTHKDAQHLTNIKTFIRQLTLHYPCVSIFAHLHDVLGICMDAE